MLVTITLKKKMQVLLWDGYNLFVVNWETKFLLKVTRRIAAKEKDLRSGSNAGLRRSRSD